MKKTLLSLFAFLLIGVSAASADVIETVGATDCSSGWTVSNTKLAINGDGGAHFTFVNHNVTTKSNWNNFVFEANDGQGKYIDMRADNYGWGDLTSGVRYSNTYDWDNFMSDLNGATVDMYIYKKGTHVLVESTITTTANATRKYQAYYPNANAENLSCYLIVDGSYLEITKAETAALPTNVDIADEVVGYIDCTSGYLGISSTEYQLDNVGSCYEVKFKNISKAEANFKNWILRCYNNDAAWTMNFNLRADNAAGFTDCWSWDAAASKYGFTMKTDFDWTTFPADMNGATVDMKIWRLNNVVYVDAVIVTSTGKNWTYKFTMPNITSSNCYWALSQESAVLDIQSVEAYHVTPKANCQGYVTFYDAANAWSVDRTKARIYVAEQPAKDASTIKLNYVDDAVTTINAGQAVVLRSLVDGEEAIALTATSDANTTAYDSNALKATTAAGTVDNAYVLGYTAAEGFGFYKYEASLAKSQVYVQAASGAKLNIVFDDDVPTAVAGVAEANTAAKTVKAVVNGQLVIKTANGKFNAAGARVK